MQGQKHLVKCRCVLPQFKKLESPPPHHFPVFSKVDDDGKVIVKLAQCNNCGLIHRVYDLCSSEIVKNKESTSSIVKIEDIRGVLHQNFVNILEANSVDLPTWEAVCFIVENKQWGSFVVLSSEQDEDEVNGKYIRILGESLCKVETFLRSTGLVK